MMTLTFKKPEFITHHFNVTTVLSDWNHDYVNLSNAVVVPKREPRVSLTRILQAKGLTSSPLTPTTTGLYLLAFDLPTPHLYVGMAAAGGAAPEGVLSRIRKHCVKTMGVDAGQGVHHPEKWRNFAVSRHQHLKGQPDSLSDVRYVVAQSSDGNLRPTLQLFESNLCKNTQGILTEIYKALWPDQKPEAVKLLTQGTVKGTPIQREQIKLWCQ